VKRSPIFPFEYNLPVSSCACQPSDFFNYLDGQIQPEW
jgi:hypothetical protein